MSPLEIEILLFHHYTPAKHPYLGSDAVKGDREAIYELARRRYLIHEYGNYRLTDKGKVYVDAIMNVPEPVERIAWIIPEMEENQIQQYSPEEEIKANESLRKNMSRSA